MANKEELVLITTRKSMRFRTYEDKDGTVTVWPEGGFQLFPKPGTVQHVKMVYVNDAGLNPAGLCGNLVLEWVETEKVSKYKGSGCLSSHETCLTESVVPVEDVLLQKKNHPLSETCGCKECLDYFCSMDGWLW